MDPKTVELIKKLGLSQVPRALRECYKKDGTHKKIFLSEGEAETEAQPIKAVVYQCSFGHWHLSRRGFITGKRKRLKQNIAKSKKKKKA